MMLTPRDKTIAILNSLINIYRSNQLGFSAAAHAGQPGPYGELFESYSQQRAQFVSELEDELSRLTHADQAGEGVDFQDERKKDWPRQIHPLILRQHEQIRQEYERLCHLKS